MTKTNFDVPGINFLSSFSGEMENQVTNLQVLPSFQTSLWYKDIIFVLQNLQAPVDMEKNRARFIKLKAVKYCVLNGCLY